MDEQEIIESGREIIRVEARAVEGLLAGIGERFAAAVELIRGCAGRVVVTGMGKAGIIGRKIAGTLASTGTPAIYLHAADAFHGDLGMVQDGDVVLALSNSGETEEVLRLIQPLRTIGAMILAMTAERDSTLGKHADAVLELGRIAEAGPLGIAPSASTTAMLALGDALALTLQKAREFTPQEYVRFHPGGSLGRSLLCVEDIMRTDDRCPTARIDETLGEVIQRMTRAGAGCSSVVDEDGSLLGVITDGDFRRQFAGSAGVGALDLAAGEVMTAPCTSILHTALVAEAMGVLRDHRINALPVVDRYGCVTGLLDVQDIVGLRLDPASGERSPAWLDSGRIDAQRTSAP